MSTPERPAHPLMTITLHREATPVTVSVWCEDCAETIARWPAIAGHLTGAPAIYAHYQERHLL